MEHLSESDRHLADLLVKHRAAPDDAVVERMERRLLGRRPAAAQRRLRLTLALGGGIAAVAFGAILAGGSPSGEDAAVQADPKCRPVVVEHTERQPTVVVGSDGKPRVEQRERKVQRTITRCR